MADFKTILALTKEADDKDQPYIDTIKSDLIALIDAANLAEIEYKVIYDIGTVVNALPSLQEERIKLKIGKRLRDLGYQATIVDDTVTITWTIATLSQAL